MKKLIRILGIFIIVVILAIVLIPFIFKGHIAEVLKIEANERLNANVDFTGIRLSLFRSFPDMSVKINKLTIIGVDEFDEDTLANIEKVYVSVNLMSMIKGSDYKVNAVTIDHPHVNLYTNLNGKVNWDIQKPSVPEIIGDSSISSTPSSYTLTIKSLKINEGFINYLDDKTNTHVIIKDMDHSLSGDLTAISTTLKTKTTIDDLTVHYDNIPYFENSQIDFKADLEADLENHVFTLSDNILMINEVLLGLNGSVSVPATGIVLDLSLNTKGTAFKDVLSLIPSIYTEDYNDIEADGIFSIDGFVKGIYTEVALPSFMFNLSVNNAWFNYPDLPTGISDINIISTISSPGGSPDNTVIEVEKMNMRMAGNHLNASLKLITPISDPDLDLTVDGTIDLQNVKSVYPLEENEEISGEIFADINFSGKLSAVDAGDVNSFEASGFAEISDLVYSGKQFPTGLYINKSRLDFYKEYIDLKSFNCMLGTSDIGAKGRIENYLPHIFYDEAIKGSFTLLSDRMNLDEMLGSDTTDQDNEHLGNLPVNDTISPELGAIVIPENIDFFITSSFSELIYRGMEMKDVRGIIKIHNQELILQNLNMRVFGGRIQVNGIYESRDIKNPTVDLDLKLKDLDVQETYNTWAILREYVPAVKKTEGSYSSGFNIKTGLNSNMMPQFATLTGAGDLLSSKILIKDIQVFNQLSEILKIDQFKNMMIDPVNMDFEFLEGAMLVKPFDFTMGNIKASLGGTTSFDKNINYVMSMKIPREMFGDSFNDVYQSLLGKTGDLASFLDIPFVNLDVIIGGTLDNPTLKTGLKESMEDVVEDLKNKAQEELEKKKKELEQKLSEEAEKYIALAEEQAEKIMNEARTRADDIKNLARQTADRINYEADTNANKLIAEGKKNGFLAEIAAKAAAAELKNQANVRANQIIAEADKNADAILNKAQQQADAIVNEARERYKVK